MGVPRAAIGITQVATSFLRKRTAVGLTEGGCSGSGGLDQKYPLTGLGPAIHVLMQPKAVPLEDVDARGKPGEGDFLKVCGARAQPNAALES
jgi:hypothetical protein